MSTPALALLAPTAAAMAGASAAFFWAQWCDRPRRDLLNLAILATGAMLVLSAS